MIANFLWHEKCNETIRGNADEIPPRGEGGLGCWMG